MTRLKAYMGCALKNQVYCNTKIYYLCRQLKGGRTEIIMYIDGMRLSNDYKMYLEKFISNIQVLGFLKNLKLLAEQKAVSSEVGNFFCSYNEEDEDYISGKVTLIYWGDGVGALIEEDTIVYIEPEIFYNYLYNAGEEYIREKLEHKGIVEELLKKIKEDLFRDSF